MRARAHAALFFENFDCIWEWLSIEKRWKREDRFDTWCAQMISCKSIVLFRRNKY